MRVLSRSLGAVVLLTPTVFRDDRGCFFESFNKAEFGDLTGSTDEFVQDNHSVSREGVLRGLHYQLPGPQGKLVRCVGGAVWDVAVDIRSSSPTFRSWVAFELTEANHRQLWIPQGFAHGFAAISDEAHVAYKTTEPWSEENDRVIAWDDPELAIEWPIEDPRLSDRDAAAPPLRDAAIFD